MEPSTDDTVVLFRPVGRRELDLIESADYRAFPPRLPDQPIFYPVLNESYARQIARDWNAKLNHDHAGYVTRFAVRASFLEKYDIQTVGGSEHQECWIPARGTGGVQPEHRRQDRTDRGVP